MALEAIIILIILIPVAMLVIIRRKRDGTTGFRTLLRRIAGTFLLVGGILLLFPAFYRFFHGRGEAGDLAFLALSLVLVFGGHRLAGEGKPCPHKEP